LHFHLTAGQAHESTVLDELLIAADAELVDGNKKRVAWPLSIAGDMGYRAEWIDEYLLALGVNPIIPTPSNQDRDKRVAEFDRKAYRDRNIIERLIGWLKECRRIFSRFEKTAKNFAGMIKMAFIERYFKLLTS
jgi:transposase